MFYGAFVTVAALTLSPTPQPARPSPPASVAGRHAAVAERHPPEGLRLASSDPNALYSLRARKRFAAYLRLRLLELRQEHLTRAADAIERRIPVSALLDGP